MMYRWTLGSLSAVCLCLLFPVHSHGQQRSAVAWQGDQLRSSSFQSLQRNDSSPQADIETNGQPASPTGSTQPFSSHQQPLVKPHAQKPTRPNTQELPSVWPQPQSSSPPQSITQTQQPEQTEQRVIPLASPATAHVSGYLGVSTRNFYRERLCMHALTIRGVEVETVLANSPLRKAGLRPARDLTTKETVVATAAGVLTLTPAAAIAPSFVSFAGGVPHGDIILAVNGQRVWNKEEFQNAMTRTRAQTMMYLTVHRGETNVQVPVRLSERPTITYPSVQ